MPGAKLELSSFLGQCKRYNKALNKQYLILP